MERPLDVNNIEDPQETEQKTMGDKKRGNTGSDDVEDDDLEYTTDSDSEDDESVYGKILMKFDNPEKYAAFCKLVDETKKKKKKRDGKRQNTQSQSIMEVEHIEGSDDDMW
ncbi:myb domain protein 5 [Striga asiatica]|uniref:Myb domain protein 5 n=1 Tax=Striga asiatica TaxID=4170 RepID=A0A5A7QI51_STRAF|nr:myb domain protein 5 [Striga asiatica]